MVVEWEWELEVGELGEVGEDGGPTHLRSDDVLRCT